MSSRNQTQGHKRNSQMYASNARNEFDFVSVTDQAIYFGGNKGNFFSGGETPRKSSRQQAYPLRTGIASSRGSSVFQDKNGNGSSNLSSRMTAAISAMKNNKTDFVSRGELHTA